METHTFYAYSIIYETIIKTLLPQPRHKIFLAVRLACFVQVSGVATATYLPGPRVFRKIMYLVAGLTWNLTGKLHSRSLKFE